MRKFLLVFLLSLVAVSVNAHEYGYRHHGGYGYGWVAPTIIGGVIGYELANRPVVVQQQPVIIQQPVYTQPYPVGTNCTPWQVVQMPDGTYTQTRTCQ
jgi:hypothetical protein